MKNRRARILALLIAVLATGLATPYWHHAYLRVGYAREVARNDGWVTYRKRATWLPGVDEHVPDQTCHFCLRENHTHCTWTWGDDGRAIRDFQERGGCTCQHRSHSADD